MLEIFAIMRCLTYSAPSLAADECRVGGTYATANNAKGQGISFRPLPAANMAASISNGRACPKRHQRGNLFDRELLID
jgi:hypothetical protein